MTPSVRTTLLPRESQFLVIDSSVDPLSITLYALVTLYEKKKKKIWLRQLKPQSQAVTCSGHAIP